VVVVVVVEKAILKSHYLLLFFPSLLSGAAGVELWAQRQIWLDGRATIRVRGGGALRES
jgi:hypothetical protein